MIALLGQVSWLQHGNERGRQEQHLRSAGDGNPRSAHGVHLHHGRLPVCVHYDHNLKHFLLFFTQSSRVTNFSRAFTKFIIIILYAWHILIYLFGNTLIKLFFSKILLSLQIINSCRPTLFLLYGLWLCVKHTKLGVAGPAGVICQEVWFVTFVIFGFI